MTDTLFAEYSKLVQLRDRAAYGVTGAAIVSVAFLHLNDPEKAHLALQEAVAVYQEAAEQVEQFHRNAVLTHSQSAAQEAA